MFPVVPDNETRTEPENVSSARTEAPTDEQPNAEAPVTSSGTTAPREAPAETEANRTAPQNSSGRTDIFTVPEPAPPKTEPEPPAPATEDTFTHYVHLADGRVLKADLSAITEHIGDRYYEDRNTDNERSTMIIGVYPR